MLKEKIVNLPVPILPVLTGVLTLSNVYSGLGFVWVRHFLMGLVGVIWLAYLAKIVIAPGKCLEEYNQVIPCSLYGGFTMTLMILSSYIAEYVFGVGQALWLIATIGHIIHIVIFTVKYFSKHISLPTFVPSWFVTYNGVAVAVVVGKNMGFAALQNGIMIYCCAIYLVLIPLMIRRLATKPIPHPLYHTQAVVIAPVSLSIVTYLARTQTPQPVFVGFLAILLAASLLFYVWRLPYFFAFNFLPSFAGITFPMSIGVVATGRLATFWEKAGHVGLSQLATQIQGFQLFLTTVAVGYVFIRLLMLIAGVDERVRQSYPDAF